ncbi:spermine/spermidine synthase domain-containing protein [Thiomonas sp.]
MKRLRQRPAGQPFICQERGEVSLHFGMATVQSRMRVATPDKLVLDYTRGMMAFLLLAPEPRHIVMLGLGGGSLAKYCHAHLRHTRFTALEISPEVIAMRDLFAIPPDDDRLQVLCIDGAAWLYDNPACCDVLMLDGFDADGLPPALCSQAFFDDCAAALQPGGVLVSNIWAKDSLRAVLVERLRQSFGDHVATILAEDGENTIALASKQAAMPCAAELHERARQLSAKHAVDLSSSAAKLAQALATAPKASALREPATL